MLKDVEQCPYESGKGCSCDEGEALECAGFDDVGTCVYCLIGDCFVFHYFCLCFFSECRC